MKMAVSPAFIYFHGLFPQTTNWLGRKNTGDVITAEEHGNISQIGLKIKENTYIWKVILEQLVCSKWPLDDL